MAAVSKNSRKAAAAPAASPRAPAPPSFPTKVGHVAFANVGQFVVAIIIATSILYGFDRREPVTIGAPEVAMINVVPGSPVDVHWTQDWHRSCSGVVERTLVTQHGEIKTFKKFVVDPPSPLRTVAATSQMYVPHNTPPGEATLNSTISFSCNPLQDYWPIVVKAPPIKVVVLPEAGKAD